MASQSASLYLWARLNDEEFEHAPNDLAVVDVDLETRQYDIAIMDDNGFIASMLSHSAQSIPCEKGPIQLMPCYVLSGGQPDRGEITLWRGTATICDDSTYALETTFAPYLSEDAMRGAAHILSVLAEAFKGDAAQ